MSLFVPWIRSNLRKDTGPSFSSWLLTTLLPRQWSVATGADKELVDAKTRVRDLVIESVTLCHSAGGDRERLEETLQRSKQGQTAMLMGTSI